MKIFMISGKAGSGKSTFAGFCKYLYDNTKIIPIASSIKDIAYQMGWDGNKDAKGRKLLIEIGRIGREYDPDTWISKLVRKLDDSYDLVCIDDWRFKNEYEFVCNYVDADIVTIRIIRDYVDPYIDPTDPSENDLDDFNKFDYIVYNNSTFDVLRKTCGHILNKEGVLWTREP